MVKKGETITVCTFAERMENQGIQIGMQTGIREGIQTAKKELVQKKLAKGKSVEEIADALEETVDAIEKMIEELEKKDK